MTRIAIVGCRREIGADASDLYPDPDAGPLERAVVSRGAAVDLVAWDDPAVGFDLVPGPGGEPLIIEVEMIDPYLALDLAPTAADELAETLLALARR
jgi:hypothetical protein